MPPKRPKRPAGFVFLTVCSLTCAVLMARLLANPTLDGIPLLPARMAFAVNGALALVTAEALWRVRPWAYTASMWFALAFLAMLFVVTGSLTVGVAMSAPVLIFIFVALGIVYRGLFPARQSVRVRRSP